ncbi:Peptidyl-prolyl cis-trans isomerase H [Wallemia ichthyophaga EXF-994]|uniref:Peptidyl-prolyl cis-trans isomerase n=1 Tax=Wallemia ichthyophaga (strain EXF-994 / CBS 113033) TaxID=1299270 RepID=R9AHN0_WALI9|nr:Peptidyl-prolyl cis-trans isomerase H [Wallemia ichthyophaga EXF-994]EOR01640.1 Peptidyl-prolyl cis-trans isomerase H [Wallemia ichthyophaga EXF-994]
MTSTRPVVFFDVALGESALGRIKMELFSDITPKTAENFRQLCTGEQRVGNVPQGYKNSSFHRGGDFINEDGTGSYSIYGGAKFQDENFTVKHDQPGLLSMANSGPNTNGCQTPFLDGKHTVFGKVVEGMLTLRKIENVQTGANNKPKLQVRIKQCGEM